MAFVKRTWLARLGQGLNKFFIGEKDAQGKQELTNAPDSITQQGDVISADNLNDLEGRIQAGFNDLTLKKIWEITNEDFSSDVTLDLGEVAEELVIEYTTTMANRADTLGFLHIKGTSTSSLNAPTMSLFANIGTYFYSRLFKEYTTNGTTKLVFYSGRYLHFDSSASTWDYHGNEAFVLVPQRIYKVVNIYS